MKFNIVRTSNYDAKPTEDSVYVGTYGYFGYKMYTIEIRTLEELMKLIEKEGQIVISPNSKGLPTIKIYDVWWE